jgi:hypothetical protein
MAEIDLTFTLSLNFDVADLERRLLDSERAVLVNYESAILEGIRDDWVGWKYKGRPDDAPRLVSWDAWASRIETTEGRARLFLFNRARDWKTKTRAYAAYVHRVDDKTPEWERVFDDIVDNVVPSLIRDLTAEIEKNLSAPKKRQRLRTSGGGRTVRRTMEG